MRMALFDFDGTLCPGDSIVPYLRLCVREGLAPKAQWLRAGLGYILQRLRLIPVSRAKAMTLSFIRGRSREEMDALARRFFREELLPRCHPEGLREIRRLRNEGIRVAVISASPEVYMRVLPEFVKVDAVLATPCEEDPKGLYTGEVGPNCRGEEKVRRVREAWPDAEIVTAYGDSRGDLPMLAMTDRAVLVNAGGRLASKAGVSTVTWREEAGRC
ncbi:MAG: HAD-IB family hydrolase [Clostridia bacterium]|nr:HAD-IB family hydrolase [Clostridia bacterium]